MSARYENEVALKYNVYNSIFLMLRFEKIRDTGIFLPVFSEDCRQGFSDGRNPEEILRTFVERYRELKETRAVTDLLFRFIQYIERQIVLID
ncbi:MAG: hypothetical protein R3330_06590, partial [Saprospiraceae bacterium]|nr:hypothetical protein [Saprospiraceae bacterium]